MGLRNEKSERAIIWRKVGQAVIDFFQYCDVINLLAAVVWHDCITIKNKKRIFLILITIYQYQSRGRSTCECPWNLSSWDFKKEFFLILKISQLLKKFCFFDKFYFCNKKKFSIKVFLFHIILVQCIVSFNNLTLIFILVVASYK